MGFLVCEAFFQYEVISVVLVLTLGCSALFTAFAETFYVYNGYVYSRVSNGTVSLFGWEGGTDTLVVPETIGNDTFVSVGSYAFENDESIAHVDMKQAANLTTIGRSAFYRSSALQSIVLPPNLSVVGDLAFQNCTALEEVSFGETLTYLSSQMFYGCTALQRVTLPASMQKIGHYCFADCTSLTRVDIPASVTDISDSAFDNTPNLVIYCRENSYAQTYAEEKGISYVTVSKGDVNLDFEVTISDATLVQMYLAEFVQLNDEQLYYADMSDIGEVSISDATMIQYKVAGF